MFNLNAQIKSHDVLESGELKIKGKASTPSTDRARDVILTDAWAKGGLLNYTNNPILLFNHNYDEPIGKVTDIQLTEAGLEIEGVVFEGTKAYPLIEKGVLKTFSVGFMIKDADYNQATDGLIIKEAELLEISVVSVPCNQDATFELSKNFSDEKYEKLKKQFGKKTDEGASTPEPKEMTKEEIEKMLADSNKQAVETALKQVEDARIAREEEAKRLADEKAAKEAEEVRISASVEKSVGEKIEEAVKKALETGSEETSKTIQELSETIKNNQEELKSLRESRGGFFPDKENDRSKWMEAPENKAQAIEAFILSKAMKKDFADTSMGKEIMEKLNTNSSVQVSSDTFEQTVSTEIYRDIEQALIIKPLFREITMQSASQLLTIAPDTGYATHQTTGSTLPGTKPNGLLNNKDGSQPYALEEVSFRTDKLVSKAYLANDTDEDVIIPLLPLIRDAMIRQHAKSVDQMILTAGVAGSLYPNMVSKGLAAYAATAGRTVDGPAAGEPITGRHLLAARSSMGKYGLNAADLAFVVSTNAYYELLKDEDFYNNDEVGTGTKITGEVGRMFGTRIMVSAELSETVAEGEIAAYVLNTRNFVVPRLRGLTSESEYSVDGQHWLLATTQRLGFTEIIPGAPSVAALAYAAETP